MKTISLLFFFVSFLFSTGCSFSQEKQNREITDIDSDVSLVKYESLEINKIYTDTIIFSEYMYVDDFDRIRVTKKGKNLFPLYDKNDTSLNRGDLAVLTWTVDSVWIPQAPNDKRLSPIVKNITKIKDGKLSLYKKKYPQPMNYIYHKSLREKYSDEILGEIYDIVQYYLANTKQPLTISDIKNESDSIPIEYWIDEKDRVENGAKNTYIAIALPNDVENQNSKLKWLYLKRNDHGYMDIYEYDQPNDQLILFN